MIFGVREGRELRGELRAPPGTSGDLRGPPGTSGESTPNLRGPPGTSGALRLPPGTSGDLRGLLMTSGDHQALPNALPNASGRTKNAIETSYSFIYWFVRGPRFTKGRCVVGRLQEHAAARSASVQACCSCGELVRAATRIQHGQLRETTVRPKVGQRPEPWCASSSPARPGHTSALDKEKPRRLLLRRGFARRASSSVGC